MRYMTNDKRKDEDDDATPENDIRQAHVREQGSDTNRGGGGGAGLNSRGTPFGLLLDSSPNLNAG